MGETVGVDVGGAVGPGVGEKLVVGELETLGLEVGAGDGTTVGAPLEPPGLASDSQPR